MQQIRLYETHSCRIFKQIDETHPIAEINEFMNIYCERIPEEELNMDAEAGDRLVSCFHFEKEPGKSHGIPFFFLVKPGEVWKDTLARLSKRTGIKGKLLEKISFRVVKMGGGFSRPAVVEDGESSSPSLFRKRIKVGRKEYCYQIPRTARSFGNDHHHGQMTGLTCDTLALTEDDVLADKIGADDLLGLDHVNKARGYVGKYESLNIR